jgi:hypothetical protein
VRSIPRCNAFAIAHRFPVTAYASNFAIAKINQAIHQTVTAPKSAAQW